jgi:glycosyltransferase involved in cell wall biosynthesis
VVSLAWTSGFRLANIDTELETLPTEDPYLLHVGVRSKHKNFRILLAAYSRWARRNECSLVTVGAPFSNQEMQYMQTTGISSRVHLMSDVDDDRLCQLYNGAAAFVYPSLYEGFGIPLLEAMACGCPIIASCIPSTLEVAGECPIYFEPSDSDDLIAAFDTAIAEGRNSERAHLGLRLVQRYSWDETARKTLEIYHALSDSS